MRDSLYSRLDIFKPAAFAFESLAECDVTPLLSFRRENRLRRKRGCAPRRRWRRTPFTGCDICRLTRHESGTVAVSTNGLLGSTQERTYFKMGLARMRDASIWHPLHYQYSGCVLAHIFL